MKKLLFLIGLLSICSFAVADIEKYAVDRKDGGVSIVYYENNSEKSLEKVLEDSGFTGMPIIRLNDSDIPKSRADRKYWKLSGNKITIDEIEKQNDALKQQQLEADKIAVLEKLKISKEEFSKLTSKSTTALSVN